MRHPVPALTRPVMALIRSASPSSATARRASGFLAGLTDASAGFDTDEYAHQSSQVQAVVDLMGRPT
ncbi:hypothetical protein [Candidatus Amarolinea dominans]|uniref:hypothetical protein n=1 Tax=Candidatus Amarolinea dominans TaxID=3140696 RepID=UPI003135788D|nr:hypothetical protein [Anaerolineae bacterium]